MTVNHRLCEALVSLNVLHDCKFLLLVKAIIRLPILLYAGVWSKDSYTLAMRCLYDKNC